MSVLLATTYTSDIAPLPDGLLVTGRSKLKLQVMEYTVLVTLDQPKVNTEMISKYGYIKEKINKALATHTITKQEADQWIQVL